MRTRLNLNSSSSSAEVWNTSLETVPRVWTTWLEMASSYALVVKIFLQICPCINSYQFCMRMIISYSHVDFKAWNIAGSRSKEPSWHQDPAFQIVQPAKCKRNNEHSNLLFIQVKNYLALSKVCCSSIFCSASFSARSETPLFCLVQMLGFCNISFLKKNTDVDFLTNTCSMPI